MLLLVGVTIAGVALVAAPAYRLWTGDWPLRTAPRWGPLAGSVAVSIAVLAGGRPARALRP